jgi:hypothetical protein
MVPVEELTRSASASARASDIALEISHALGESLSVVQAQYFGDNDMGKLEGILAKERDCQGTPAVVPTRASIHVSALNKGGSGDPGAQSIVGRARARTGGI